MTKLVGELRLCQQAIDVASCYSHALQASDAVAGAEVPLMRARPEPPCALDLQIIVFLTENE